MTRLKGTRSSIQNVVQLHSETKLLDTPSLSKTFTAQLVEYCTSNMNMCTCDHFPGLFAIIALIANKILRESFLHLSSNTIHDKTSLLPCTLLVGWLDD